MKSQIRLAIFIFFILFQNFNKVSAQETTVTAPTTTSRSQQTTLSTSTQDIDECSANLPTNRCHENAVCTNTPGSFTCQCGDGYTGNGVGSSGCQDINECSGNTANCNQNATCTNTQGYFTCRCIIGYSGNGIGDNGCQDFNECSRNTDNCDQNALCINTQGSFTCRCNVGYTGNARTCSDINECSRGTDNCHDTLATCKNTQGSFTCRCRVGYTGNGRTCSDINECTRNTNNCDQNALCTNTLGSFICRCNAGYTGNARTCSDINECSRGTDNCHDTLATCINTQGSFTCRCRVGYTGNGRTCSDINECTRNTDNCDQNALCTNTLGSFICRCNAGYTGNARTCSDINECSRGTDNCHDTLATCINTQGSFTCRCNNGYTGNGRTCIDINECTRNTDSCNQNAVCTNIQGSFTCRCRDGFSGNGIGDNGCQERKTENSAGTCSYYFSSSTVESYDNAVRQCNLRRAVLAKFKSSAELRFARTTINTIYPSTTNNYYVGTTREMNNQWLWTDGDSVLPIPSGTSNCAGITTTSFPSVSCRSTRYFSCEQRIGGNVCQPNPCQNGGSCTHQGCTFTCSCATNYFGYICDTQQLQIVTDSEMTAIRGSDINLEFSVSAFVDADVLCILRINEENLRTFQVFRFTQSLSYRVIDIQTDGSYVLTCVLTTTNNNVNRQIQQVDIIVHVPASILISQTQVNIERNDSPEVVVVECTASGTPPPTVTWRSNNKDVSTSSSSSVYQRLLSGSTPIRSLILTNAEFEDQGVYNCIAYNLVGPLAIRQTASRNISVAVTGIPELVPTTEYLVFSANNRATFECLFDAIPLPTLRWTYFNGTDLPQSSQFEVGFPRRLTDYRVSLSLTLYGTSCKDVSLLGFRCQATNSLAPNPVFSQQFVVNINRNFWRYSNVPRTCLEARSYCAGKGGLLIAFPNIDVLTEINGINAIESSYWISSQTLDHFESWDPADMTRMPNPDGCIRVSKSNGIYSVTQTRMATTVCDVRILLQPNITASTDECDGERATVSWNTLPGASSFGNQLVYFVGRESRINQTFPTGILSADINDLVPRTTYKVQVVPLFEGCNIIVPTRQVTFFNTTRGELSPPVLVNLRQLNGICTVSWEFSNTYHETGAYMVRYIARARQSSNNFEPEVDTTEVDSSIDRFVIPSLRANSQYEVMVGAVASSPCADRVSIAWSNQMAGTCQTQPSAPLDIPLTQATITASQVQVTLTPASNRNGMISCYFVVVQRVLNNSDVTAVSDIDVLQQNSDDSNAKYIAYATNLTETMNLDLGEGGNSCCDVSGNIITECTTFNNSNSQRNRRAANSIVQGQNQALDPDSEYQYYVITATPDPDSSDVIYASSPVSERFSPMAVSAAGDNVGLIVGILIILLIIIIVLVVVFLKRKQVRHWLNKKSKKSSPRNFRQDLRNRNLRNSPNESIEQQIDLVEVNAPDPFNDFYIPTSELLTVYYNKSNDDNSIFCDEFQDTLRHILSNSKIPTTYANLPQNKPKNRYKNIMPIDMARVILSKLPGDSNSDYINASFIDGFSEKNKFIAAQGPKPTTTNDFWRMVYENNCTIIVMLTLVEENHKKKCDQYWPDLNEEKVCGNIHVKNVNEFANGEYLKRSLIITRGNDMVEIHHFQYLTWPDHGVPATTSAILQLHNDVMATRQNDMNPLVVHCSAGVGRTGTFIALDILSDEMSSQGCVNVLKCVHDMRLNRTEMVQGIKQYVLIHKLLVEILELGSTEVEVDRFLRYTESLKIVNRQTHVTGLRQQFNNLEMVPPFFTDQETARKPLNLETYQNSVALPYDHNLAFVSMSNKDSDVPFINASVIQSYNAGYFYIAAQNPLPSNIHLFWRCVADNEINCIVMLAKNDISCPMYWADEKETTTYNDVTVRCSDSYDYPGYYERTLEISFETSKKSHTVKQMVYTGWLDESATPNSTIIVEILSKVEKYLSSAVKVRGKKFIALFHCIDGSDRSGTVCAIANLLDRLKNENRIDVFRTVKDLRDLRAGMVYSFGHYQFCYDAVCEFIETFDLYGNFK